MPTNPATPNAGPSVDRLALGIESPRGTEASNELTRCTICSCFETETSSVWICCGFCFESGDSDTAG